MHGAYCPSRLSSMPLSHPCWGWGWGRITRTGTCGAHGCQLCAKASTDTHVLSPPDNAWTHLPASSLSKNCVSVCAASCQRKLAAREVNELPQGHAARRREYSREPRLLTALWTALRPQLPRNTGEHKHIQRKEPRLVRSKTSGQLDRKRETFPP